MISFSKFKLHFGVVAMELGPMSLLFYHFVQADMKIVLVL